MVSFWDHMKSVLKTIKKKSHSCPGKRRDPGQKLGSAYHAMAERLWLAPIPPYWVTQEAKSSILLSASGLQCVLCGLREKPFWTVHGLSVSSAWLCQGKLL